ncbi:MAG: cupin domain-containing protein [Devosiaceae bacterium]|nr:cupin domain-containing protein [Devosiaceae bacterium]
MMLSVAPSMDSKALIEMLELKPHPEGGWYKQMFEDLPEGETRAKSTAIYYLLERGDRSHWHRVDAAEIWHFYAGAPLELAISADGKSENSQVLGTNMAIGERPQLVVKPGEWQSAKSLGDWTLCGCTVAPGFRFAGFEMAPDGWAPEK